MILFHSNLHEQNDPNLDKYYIQSEIPLVSSYLHSLREAISPRIVFLQYQSPLIFALTTNYAHQLNMREKSQFSIYLQDQS